MQAMKNWTFKDPIKVAVLHIANKTLTREQDAVYNRFKAEEPFPFLIHGIVYLPTVCVVGVTNIDRSLLAIDGDLEFTTIMTHNGIEEADAKVVAQVFANPDMRRHRGSSLNEMTTVGSVDVELQGKRLRAYLLPFRRKILIDATTRCLED